MANSLNVPECLHIVYLSARDCHVLYIDCLIVFVSYLASAVNDVYYMFFDLLYTLVMLVSEGNKVFVLSKKKKKLFTITYNT